MAKPIFVIVGLLLVAALPGAASASFDDDTKAVAHALNACLATDRGGSTYGMVQCYGDAYTAYDKLLNQTYGELMQTLDPPSRDLLRDAQRAWLQSRKADSALWGGSWRQQAGTNSRIEGALSDMEAVRSRLLQLQALQIAASPG